MYVQAPNQSRLNVPNLHVLTACPVMALLSDSIVITFYDALFPSGRDSSQSLWQKDMYIYRGSSQIVRGSSQMVRGSSQVVRGSSQIVRGSSQVVRGSSQICATYIQSATAGNFTPCNGAYSLTAHHHLQL